MLIVHIMRFSGRNICPLRPSFSGPQATRSILQQSRVLHPFPTTSQQHSFSQLHQQNMSTHRLDKNIFNHKLYKDVQAAFFEGVELGATEIDFAVLKRWFMGTPEEKQIFDNVCREKFGRALDAIGPEQLPRPTAEPFLRELKEVAEENAGGDGSEVAWTAVSMALLLDQVPRNIFRTNEGLVKVYTHYDEIAHSFSEILLSAKSPIGRPDLHPQWRLSLPHIMWFYMPLVHSEKIASHDLYDQVIEKYEKELKQEKDNEGRLAMLAHSLKSEKEHRDILEQFGRYPHRNACLGRKSTPEEEKFLAEGGATFGVAQAKS
ncbi:unnamed protein product [Periconia digitata]|uniref:DUF924-domain-containing protein n=1 Tax=Periconia digitata TaxID=1303443 RepID=A0A9W4U625_9PLEO|nr:unnamed protein product [Periconia digitata]